MAIREGMIPLISTLRAMTNAGTADYTLSTTPFWTNQQLQDTLDRYRSDHYRQEISPVEEYSGGAVTYTRYYIGSFNVERGTAVFWVEDSQGNKKTVDTDYTVDYNLGLVTFAANTTGLEYYATYHSYDLSGAAAEVWRMKASHYADFFNFTTGGHTVNKGDMIKHALEMAEYYTKARGTRSLEIARDDLC